jgi:hypothetical protein
MGLLSPWFLAGMAAIGLPIWLHLLRQYKQTPRPFSSVMFFEQRRQSSIRHRRLRYLALLALRCSLLFLLALAFANPYINRPSTTAGRRKLTIIALDRSFSMRYGKDLERAKATARQVISNLGGRDLAQVLGVDSHVEAMSQAEFDKNALAAAVDSIRPTDQASSFGELTRVLRVMDQTTGMQLNVHFISDMQETSMPGYRDLQLGPHTSLTLHRAGERNRPNWAVESLAAPTHVYDGNETRLTATVAGWQTGQSSRTVTLYLDNKQLASKEVQVPANGRAQADFLSFHVPYGLHRGEIRIQPDDQLADDDSFPFAVERSDPQKVLFLYTGGRSQQAFYYKAALESAPNTGLLVRPEALERAADLDLSKFAYVVVNDPGEMDPGLAQKLCGFLSRGGAVFIAVGRDTDRAGKVPLYTSRLVGEHEAGHAAAFPPEEPLLRGSEQMGNVQFFENGTLAVKPGSRVVAKLADGSPLLLEARMGEGKLLVFDSALDATTSDFPLHASFVPFVVQTGHYLAGFEETTPSLTAGSAVALRKTRDQNTAADVIGPDGKHELPLADATRAMSFTLLRDGFYEIQRADRRRLLAAVHADRRESDLTVVPDETLDLWRNTGDVKPTVQTGNLEKQTRPWSLWRYVMLLVLLAAAMESIFARRYMKEENSAI